MIDLHTHSTCSDGSLSPEALAAAARGAGLSALALTDNDTTEGVAAFVAACDELGISGVPGVELSVNFAPGTMHLLGFFMDTANEALQTTLSALRDGREIRNRKILEALSALNMDLAWDEVAALAGSDVIGRPHIAQAMMERGYVSNRQVAFKRFLARGKPAYVDRFRLEPGEGVKLVRDAGGVCVLAHPFTLKLTLSKLRVCVAELAAIGLQGIEVFYPEHGHERRQQYQRLARAFDLVMTGGSDFHGDANPAIKLGRGFDNVCVSDAILVELRGRIGR